MSSVQRPDARLKDTTFDAAAATSTITDNINTKVHDEEWANGLSHSIGCIASIIGGFYLMQAVIARGSGPEIIACTIYVAALISVYAASTLSHWVTTPGWRGVFRTWDQGLIYLLIVGTYTPLAVAHVTGWWQIVTVCMWLIALGGFISKVAMRHRIDKISLWIYLALGWLPVLVAPCLFDHINILGLILGGGIAYSVGSIFLMNDHRGRYFHVGWHLFVMAGSAIHFYAIWLCALPPT